MWHWFDNLFDHDDPASAKKWRHTMAKSVAVLLLFAICVGSALTAGVPVVGKVVFERDVAQKVAEAVEPMKKDVNDFKLEQRAQGDKIDSLLKVLNEINATNAATQMRLMKGKRCRSVDPVEREWLQREIDRLQEQYLTFKTIPYNVPACGDL